jgi:nicotinic acid mononucleotide adenylyltransferase
MEIQMFPETNTLVISAPQDNHFARTIRKHIHDEMLSIAGTLGMSPGDEPLASICRFADEHLFGIQDLYEDGDSDPSVAVQTCPGDPPGRPYARRLRVGIYPIAANPLHWGHLLIGLQAIKQLQLDKVVYVISGNDSRKPAMVSADIRHLIARDVLKRFEPLFAYSSLARDNGCDGETNLFRILRLNKEQPMDVFYIAGGDHYRRFHPGTEYPDTIVKLELHMAVRTFSYNPAVHRVKAAFIERGSHAGHVESCLDVEFLQALPFAASSTMIRAALDGTGPRSDLAILPYAAFTDIRALNLYSRESLISAINRQRPRAYSDAVMAAAC